MKDCCSITANARCAANVFPSARSIVMLAQAKAIALRLAREHFDVMYSSDLSRAMTTAQEIAKMVGIAPIFLRALREWNLKSLEGRPCSELG